jgi:hypothetical protein
MIAMIVALLLSPFMVEAQQGAGGFQSLFAGSITAIPDVATLPQKGATYVPVYSSIRFGSGKTSLDLAVTLSIHNASETSVLMLERIDYFDTAGSLVERYLPKPIALRPFATVEVFVPKEDLRGGSGANFYVVWATADTAPEPILETVMIGAVGNTSYSFVSQGRTIRTPAAK